MFCPLRVPHFHKEPSISFHWLSQIPKQHQSLLHIPESPVWWSYHWETPPNPETQMSCPVYVLSVLSLFPHLSTLPHCVVTVNSHICIPHRSIFSPRTETIPDPVLIHFMDLLSSTVSDLMWEVLNKNLHRDFWHQIQWKNGWKNYK